ncbi:hypothetical protein GA0115244_106713 [Streptomyces sp. DvalAA-19]|nr:hypothetical protein GA0115244_106713 [Streptomyces sp. DvalAA-19]
MGQLPHAVHRALDFLQAGGAGFGRVEKNLRNGVPRDDQPSLVEIVGKLDGRAICRLLRRCVGTQFLDRDSKSVCKQTQYVQAVDGLNAPLDLREPARGASDLSRQLLLRQTARLAQAGDPSTESAAFL